MNAILWLLFASVAASIALAIFALYHSRRDTADWAFVTAMFLLAAERLFGAFSVSAETLGAVQQWQQWRLLAVALLVGTLLLFSLTYARGNAAAFVFKWRFVLGCAFVIPVGLALGFRDSLFRLTQSDPAPPWLLRLGGPGIALNIVVLTGWILILMNLERTFRASVGTMRWRIKFMLLGLGLLCVARIYTSSQSLLFTGTDQRHESMVAAATLVALLVMVRSLRRTGRVPADVYPSQSVLEGSMTVLLVGVYLSVVGIFAKIAVYLGGESGFALKAFILLVSVVLLAVLLQSDRLRLHVRRVVSRNFQRPIYDYRTIWRTFTEGTASCVEQTELCRAVVKLTADVFQALAVTIWIVNEKKDSVTVAASTSLSEARSRDWAPKDEEAGDVIRYFQAHPNPVDIEAPQEKWAETLRHWHPSVFLKGGNRVCAPLLRQNEIVGIILVGDRVSGVAFPDQDMDLLKCIADQATASLLNIQLSHKVLQAKESEAFQTMATFFVHDLKNAASTLNLMLQNMPIHFGDPEFRQDALRGLGKTAAHINSLIARLSQFRGRLELRPAVADLNEIVRSTLSNFPISDGLIVNTDFATVPPVPVDAEQIQKVILNLLLNAAEACERRGEIRVLTAERNGRVVLSVADQGCGMTPEFLRSGLFRPFQTTKKSGLGIGMFQSKMIIDAHGGNVVVTSTPGQGTTFEIHLPLRGNQA